MKFEQINLPRLKETLGYILHTEEQVDNGKWREEGDIVTTRREIGYEILVKILKEARDARLQ